jgi:tetratricopeptide (TPR) repeat protein
VIAGDEPDEDLADLANYLAYFYVFKGDLERSRERLGLAIEIGESLGSAETLALAFNLSGSEFQRDRYEDALGYLEQGLEFARRRGSRPGERGTLAEMTYPLYMLGRWDEALALAAEIPEDRLQESVTLSLLSSLTEIHIHRGKPAEARRILSLFPAESSDVQEQSAYIAARAAVLHGEGRLEEALAAGFESVRSHRRFVSRAEVTAATLSDQQVKQGLLHAVECALVLGQREQAVELLDQVGEVPPGVRPPYLEAQALRLRARLNGDDAGFAAAAARFKELKMPFWSAVAQLEQAESLGGGERALPHYAEARATFERLGAMPWLDRLGAAEATAPAEIPA